MEEGLRFFTGESIISVRRGMQTIFTCHCLYIVHYYSRNFDVFDNEFTRISREVCPVFVLSLLKEDLINFTAHLSVGTILTWCTYPVVTKKKYWLKLFILMFAIGEEGTSQAWQFTITTEKSTEWDAPIPPLHSLTFFHVYLWGFKTGLELRR